MIRDLFNYEKVAWTKDAQDRLKIRNDLERPIVDAVFKKLWEKINSEILLPSQKLTKAIKYMLSYEKNFRLYLNDPNIRMENNAAERSVRKIVIGKKIGCLSEVRELANPWQFYILLFRHAEH